MTVLIVKHVLYLEWLQRNDATLQGIGLHDIISKAPMMIPSTLYEMIEYNHSD